MEAHLDALDLWEAVEEDYEVVPLPTNPTMAQIKNHKERKTRKSKEEYAGDDRIRGMKALNYIREFELQRMKESETAKEYFERLLDIVNKVRLLGTTFDNSRIVQKMLVTAPEKYEASITTLENTRDLSTSTLAELLNLFQAQEQRRSMRQNGFVEGALPVRHHEEKDFQRKQAGSNDEQIIADRNRGKGGGSKEYPPCKHCGKIGHVPFKCWRRPDAKCKKCNQLGHEAIICKSKNQEANAQVVDQDEEDQI
ncbi:uncharacterized protein LOC105635639 [Jatropha curcas]|uniref:uncharacterized protein LOC105635639 n=1 Tax=Jatropha curcas TaxID=180498 RepID=UPI001895C424|nr:uncharacterized protein LOC105635639 [Jatropha curcas]